MQRLRAGSRSPGNPFRRVIKLIQAANAAMKSGTHAEIIASQAALGEYRSRGHGRQPTTRQRSCFSRDLVDRSKYTPLACFAEGKR